MDDVLRGYLHDIEPILTFRSWDKGIIISFISSNCT